MKLSIYVPDELWESTNQRLGGKDKNPSQVVQEALQRQLSEDDARTTLLAEGISVDPERFHAVRTKLLEGARAEFERGYTAGVEFAEGLSFDQLAEAADFHDFDLEEMFGNMSLEGEPWDHWFETYENETSEGFEGRYPVFRQGVSRALRDLWVSLRDAGWGVARQANAPGAAHESGNQE
jgi:hypothetical protein